MSNRTPIGAIALVLEEPMPGTPHHCRLTIGARGGEAWEERYLSADLMSDPAGLLDIAARWFKHVGEGTLVTDRLPCYVFDDGDDSRHVDELAELVRPAGWILGEGWRRAASGWLTFTHDNRPTVHLGVRRMMTAGDVMVSKPGEEAAHDLALRLARFHELIGGAYHSMPGVGAIGALRNRYAKPYSVWPPERSGGNVYRMQPRWTWQYEPAMHGRGDVVWKRKPLPVEAARAHVYAFDVRAMYLAAAAGVRIGFNQPRHTGVVDWDPDLTGFFRIDGREVTRLRGGAVPLLNPKRVESDGSCWVTHPILAYISESGLPMPEILDSWTCGRSSNYLRPWAERIREALPDAATAGDEPLRDAVKQSYREAIGLMGRAGGRINRRDWHCAVIDEAAVRMIRKLDAVQFTRGALPLEIRTDCVWYATDDPDPLPLLAALGTSLRETVPHIGQFKVDRRASRSMSAYLKERR